MGINFIDIVFYVYTFISIYMLGLFLFLYIPNRNKMHYYPRVDPKPVSIVVPCYNDAEHIGETISAIMNMDYPKEMLELIVVDDKSTDNSVEVIKKFINKHKNIRLIINSKNSGGAAEPRNIGIKNAKYDCVAFIDSDSVPKRDALRKMIGFLDGDKIAGVTCAVLVKNPKSFIQKLQAFEYYIIAFTRKLLDSVGAVYVAPGPLALYKKNLLIKAGMFDRHNLTEDIEMVWNLMSRGYKVRMCLASRVYAASPNTFIGWWKQRIRWNIGGNQTLLKYKHQVFGGVLGNLVIPFFASSLFLGVIGLLVFVYLLLRNITLFYLSTKYSIYASTAIVSLQQLSFAPSTLNFFAAATFILGVWFTIFGLKIVDAPDLRVRQNIFNLLIYLTLYLALYPFNLIVALYKLFRREYKW